METLFKRYFWVINLLALAAAAWMLATTINEYVSRKLLAVPAAELSADKSKGGALSPRTLWADNISDELKSRRPFNSDPPAEEKVDEGGPVDEDPVEEAPEEEQVIECDQLGVNLIGTMISPEPSMSMATIEAEGATKLIRLGTSVLDKAEVREISRRYIRLSQGDKDCVVRLWGEKAPPGMRPGGRPGMPPMPVARPAQNPAAAAPRQPTQDYAAGVKQKSETEFEISRAMIDQNLEDLSTLGMQARIVPNYRNGKYEGFKLVGVRPNSLYRAIGIRSGDVIKRINGREINSPNKAIELFESLKNSSNIALDIERRGQLSTMQYTIK